MTGARLLWLNEHPVATSNAYYNYDYIYAEENSVHSGNYFTIQNDSLNFQSTTGSPCVITIEAGGTSVVNPSWNLFSGSKLLQSDGYFLTIQPGSKIEISSYPENQYADLINPDGSRSPLYQVQDLTKTNFVTIPQGQSTLIFNAGNGVCSFSFREEMLIV